MSFIKSAVYSKWLRSLSAGMMALMLAASAAMTAQPVFAVTTNQVSSNEFNGRLYNVLLSQCDTNGDGVLTTSELASYTYVDLSNQNLTDLTGIEYKLAKCCNPIYGDEVFGFVSTQGIKIHRIDCPNAPEMFSRFGYRIIRAKWSGKGDNGYIVTLRVVGRDDIAIVTNITSVIGKEEGVSLRSLNINSTDGLFQGTFTVMVRDTLSLNMLTKKIKTVKGVKSVERLNT